MNRQTLYLSLLMALVLAIVLAACGPTVEVAPTVAEVATSTPQPVATEAPEPTSTPGTPEDETTAENMVTTASGLQYIEIVEGDGPAPQDGDVVSVHYQGMLEDGTVFDSSYSRDEPIAFPLGRGYVIQGWEEGIALLNVGSKAKFIIPPELGYGSQGRSGVIPPNATLIFEVELVDILPGSPDAPIAVDENDYVTTESGLQYYDFEEGEGPTPEVGQIVAVHYTGWLADGTKFDSSLDRGNPLIFPVGTGQVIAGWDEGLSTMKVGGKRQLVIPPDLGYGASGSSGVIPPNATLIFEVELVEIQ